MVAKIDIGGQALLVFNATHDQGSIVIRATRECPMIVFAVVVPGADALIAAIIGYILGRFMEEAGIRLEFPIHVDHVRDPDIRKEISHVLGPSFSQKPYFRSFQADGKSKRFETLFQIRIVHVKMVCQFGNIVTPDSSG